jgi:hypothetical protein
MISKEAASSRQFEVKMTIIEVAFEDDIPVADEPAFSCSSSSANESWVFLGKAFKENYSPALPLSVGKQSAFILVEV